MRIGIISALQSENDLILDHMDGQVAHCEKGKRHYYQGSLWGIDSVVVICKMGKVAAAMSATQLIAEYEPDVIIFTGVAGGMHKHLSVGDIVVADALIQHDMDSHPLFPRYEIPMIGVTKIFPDERWSDMVLQAATRFVEGLDVPPQVTRGMIASGDQFVSSREQSEALARALPDVSCVEMEGAAIAQVCYEYEVPFAIVRTISDSANGADFRRIIRDLLWFI